MIGGKDFKSKDLLNLCSGHFTLKIPMVGNYYHGMSDPFQCGWKCRRGIFREPLDVHSIEASISTATSISETLRDGQHCALLLFSQSGLLCWKWGNGGGGGCDYDTWNLSTSHFGR